MNSSADENVVTAKKKSGCTKKIGAKVHRKIHKAEREKLKRDHMNDLFLELTKALESVSSQNSGKSSALTETIRIIQDLKAQVESLKKENSVLLAESQYIAVEKDELKEENRAVEAHIKKLQSQIDERAHSQSLWSSECNPVVAPVFVLPLQNDPKLYAESTVPETVTKQLGPNVSKPHARYPSPSDSWPLNILAEQPRAD